MELVLKVFALYLSTYITIAISLDRCIAILDPMRRQGATRRVRIMMMLAWGCSALFSIPQCSPHPAPASSLLWTGLKDVFFCHGSLTAGTLV
ncbi:hypothetical protein ACOMHN_013590 [Nucella lapillus]